MSSIKRKLINQLTERLYQTHCEIDSAWTWLQYFGTRNNNYIVRVMLYSCELEEGFTAEDSLKRELESFSLDELIDAVNEC